MASFTFAKKDEDILKKVKQYQKDNDIPEFSEAVRQIIKLGLDLNHLNKKDKN